MTLIGGTGAIMRIIGLPEFMEVYKPDMTFRAQAPENIDPARTKADVPWAWRISDDAGCSNPIIARVFIQCAEALNNKTLRRGDPERIKVALHACKEEVRNCEKAFRSLAIEHDKILKSIKDAGGIRVENRVVNNLPQIADLEHNATLFIISAKRALQSAAEVLNEFYGITISNARFDKGKTQLKALASPPTELLASLESFDGLIERVLNLRNFQEHTPKKTIIETFTITADALHSPMWRVDPAAGRPMLPEMHEIIGRLVDLAEQMFFIGLLDNLDLPPGPFDYVVEEIPESARTKDFAARYRCELKFHQQGPNQAGGGPEGEAPDAAFKPK